MRNAQCANYDVWWDVNRNDNYDDDWRKRATREGNSLTVRDIGRTFLVPDVDGDTSYNINVRVRNLCNNQDKFGTFRLFVYDWRPSNDPVQWSNDQIAIMSQMAIQESLWYLHRQLGSFSGRDSSTMSAQYSVCAGQTGCRETGALMMWINTINSHLPAYPPNTINAFGQALPNGWAAENDRRWNQDPYAENVIRLVQDAINMGTGAYTIPVEDEDLRCAYNPADGSQINCNRIPGTGDARGYYVGGGASSVYRMGMYLGGISTVLPALGGTPVQSGAAQGQKWEWFIQQLADYLGAQQIDGGSQSGTWCYADRGCSGANPVPVFNTDDTWQADGSTMQWAYIGLESAAVAGEPFGVYIPNRIKYRIANGIVSNQRADGGAAYRTAEAGSNFQLTGGAFVAARWMGLHTFRRGEGAVAFPGWSGYTRDRLRQSYDTYLSYASQQWTSSQRRGSHGWVDGNWASGDYLCGNRNTVYNAPRCGNMYSIYSHQKGYRTGTPELTAQELGRDWVRQFATYVMRAQDRALDVNNPDAGYSVFGRVYDEYCNVHSVTCAYSPGNMSAGMAGLVVTPTIFTPKPIAIAHVQPPEVTEGCAGGNNGRVTFDHSDSFHPSPSSRIVSWQWDVDARNGLWWETRANPDFSTGGANPEPTFTYTYQAAGDYTATLRVVDNIDQVSIVTVRIRVNPAANVPPSAAHGGPYIVEVGSNLQLRGTVRDQNEGCGDRLAVGWDLDDNNVFNDANAANANVNWAQIRNLAVGPAHRIRIQVTDRDGASVTAETTLTIVPAEPIADARVNPNPAACGAPVTFDGTGSYHLNPQRSIAQYIWDVDGDGQPDSGQARYVHQYGAFGVYDATLTVIDDQGRRGAAQVQVNVNQGNNAPVARVSAANYVVLEGDPLRLDGRLSSDPDAACGDSIQRYEWDVNGNGAFGDAIDQQGAQPVVAWDALAAAVGWPGAARNGQLVVNATLRVVDEFGVPGTVRFTITLQAGRPVAVLEQRPDPAPINLRTGVSNPTLDGRASFSPIQGTNITRWDWDLDDDGVFEVQNMASVEFRRVFNPVPGPNNIPAVFVRLQVYDQAGRPSNPIRQQIRYDVPPTVPTADADPNEPPEPGYHILVGEDVVLDGSDSFDPDEEEFGDVLVAYRWDLNYDAAAGFDGDVQTVGPRPDEPAPPTLRVTWNQLVANGINGPGDYPIALEVEDTTNLTNQDTSVIHVHARNPVAVADVNPNPAACGGQVHFDGSASNHPHPAIDIRAWRWDLDGDGAYDDGDQAQVDRVYNQLSFNGPIRIGLEVEDTNGAVGRTAVDLRVDQGNRAPIAQPGGFRDGNGRVTGPYVIAIGDALQVDGAGSSDPDAACGDSIVSFQWDVGNDGQFDAQGQRPAAFTWQQLGALGINRAGDYSVRLRVTDRLGVTTDGATLLRVVNGPRAVATADPDRAGCNQQVVFDASRSTTDGPEAQGFAIVRYEWDFNGDGVFDSNEIRVTRPVQGLPDQNGQIGATATLRVTDASGRQSTTQVNVVIDLQNLPPVAEAGGPYATGRLAGGGFANVTLDGRGSSDPNAPCDSVVVYKWDTDNDGRYGRDDAPPDLEGAQVVYNNPGWQPNTVQTVRLIVCDRFNRCSPADAADIEISNVPPPAGQIISPRGDDPDVCIGRNPFDVVLDVSHPEGEPMTVTVQVAGVAVGQRAVDPPNANPVRVSIPINPANIPEGRQLLEVHIRTDRGAETTIGSGGRIVFDRTAPAIQIDNALREGVCYNPNAVPNPDIAVQDNFDPAPVISEDTLDEGCGRTLRVTAEDACGNVGVSERDYLTAQPVRVDIAGVQDGQLVASTQITWQIVGPGGCASRIQAFLALNGGAEQAYAENTLVNQPGDYVLRVNVANCQGVALDQFVRFAVNRPPVARPVNAGHPSRDPNAPAAPFGGFGYVVSEGAALQVDASESSAPERAEVDQLVRYQWDFRNDGTFDAEGIRVDYPTGDNGTFTARLRVTDSIGAFSDQLFRVVVNDVDPIADPGGNGRYVVDQGAVFQPDGSNSRPGHPVADPIRLYTWVWGDNTANAVGANLSRPQHTYVENGVYQLTLRVDDEDSFNEAIVVVEVRDVSPVIDGIDVPQDLVELLPMRLVANVEAGAPGDPITRYEWDVDGDGVADYAGANLSAIDHVFLAAGNHTVTLTVRDDDSASVFQLPVVVREMSLAEVITWMDGEVTRREDAGNLGVPQRFALRNFGDHTDDGLWGERNQRRGNTLMAIDKMLIAMISAHNDAGNAQEAFGRQLWGMSRQLVREMTRLEAAILDEEDGPAADDDPMLRARSYIEAMEAIYNDANFERDLLNGNNANRVQSLHAAAMEAYYWLTEAVSPCNLIDLTIDRNNPDVVARTIQANRANDDLTPILSDMAADLTGYINAGGGNDPGPGRAEVQAAQATFAGIRGLQTEDVGVDCQGRDDLSCINDFDALTLELDAMSLAQELDVAGTRGVWTRNWQSCLVNTVKFRIELSVSRLEYACGRFHRISLTARQKQAVGEYMVEEPGCALNAQQGAQLRAAPAALQACQNLAAGASCLFRNVDGLDIQGTCAAGGAGVFCDPRVCSDPAALNYYRDDDQRCFLIEAYNDCLVPADPDQNQPIADQDIPAACLNQQ
ncbi:MAG: PKD domain-containing protein [Myxococcales bacterium]|nr:PKD domain-containing protein [Myxococcales bacterium]